MEERYALVSQSFVNMAEKTRHFESAPTSSVV